MAVNFSAVDLLNRLSPQSGVCSKKKEDRFSSNFLLPFNRSVRRGGLISNKRGCLPARWPEAADTTNRFAQRASLRGLVCNIPQPAPDINCSRPRAVGKLRLCDIARTRSHTNTRAHRHACAGTNTTYAHATHAHKDAHGTRTHTAHPTHARTHAGRRWEAAR